MAKKNENLSGWGLTAGTIGSAALQAIANGISKLKQQQQAAQTPITSQTGDNKAYHQLYQTTQAQEIPKYQESMDVANARQLMNPYLNGENKPTYTSKYADTIQSLADKIANREAFNYDFNTDPLYQNYRDQYQRQAVLGQQGAMANAAALTGGYGSSYAQTAGNLAYQENMANLNNVIPQLAQLAYDKYNTDLANQRADLSMYQGLEDTDYGRYRDQVSDYNTDRGYYTDYFNNERNFDYGKQRDTVEDAKWMSDYDAEQNDRMQKYNAEQHWNKVDDNFRKSESKRDQKNVNWEHKHTTERDKVSDKQQAWDNKLTKEQWEWQKKNSGKGSASGGSGRSGGGYRRSGSSGTTTAPAGVKQTLRKYMKNLTPGNGTEGQGEIAWNTIERLSKEKGFQNNDNLKNYLYYNYLGYTDAPDNKVQGRSGEIRNNAKKTKLQTWDDVPAEYQDDVMTAAQFAAWSQSNASTASKLYKSNYQTYLKKMAKKYGF